MVSEYQLTARLEHAFDALIDTTQTLLSGYDPERHPTWQFDRSLAPRQWLSLALTDYWYQDGQDGRTTRPYIGMIAADQALLEAASVVNQHKTALAELIKQLRQHYPATMKEIKATLPFRHPALHTHLKGAGLARLHLKQCWRHVPLAPAPLSRVRFAWYASGRSIKRISVEEAARQLTALGAQAPHIAQQLKRLAALPSDEALAQIQPQAPLMRANLFFAEPLNDGRQRQALNVALPLFVPAQQAAGKLVLPHCKQPPAQPPSDRQRGKRSDAQIDEEAWLPSIRVHRYATAR
ncbi:DNA replication terminus site-binding protein [Carnimonas bestiolae]|uniref:DNA replication terminus site-binding protein n=1 Tax=Carnimonas bestiolae TaxID=3402172 RepID=UPI003EDBCC07